MTKSILSFIFLVQVIPLAIAIEHIAKKSRAKAAIFEVVLMLTLAVGLMVVWGNF